MRQIFRSRRTAIAAEQSINSYFRHEGTAVEVSVHAKGTRYKVVATIDLPDYTWMVWRGEYSGAYLRAGDLSAAVIKEVQAVIGIFVGASRT